MNEVDVIQINSTHDKSHNQQEVDELVNKQESESEHNPSLSSDSYSHDFYLNKNIVFTREISDIEINENNIISIDSDDDTDIDNNDKYNNVSHHYNNNDADNIRSRIGNEPEEIIDLTNSDDDNSGDSSSSCADQDGFVDNNSTFKDPDVGVYVDVSVHDESSDGNGYINTKTNDDFGDLGKVTCTDNDVNKDEIYCVNSDTLPIRNENEVSVDEADATNSNNNDSDNDTPISKSDDDNICVDNDNNSDEMGFDNEDSINDNGDNGSYETNSSNDDTINSCTEDDGVNVNNDDNDIEHMGVYNNNNETHGKIYTDDAATVNDEVNDNKVIPKVEFNTSANRNTKKKAYKKRQSIPRELLGLCIDMDWCKQKGSSGEKVNGIDVNHKKGLDYYQHSETFKNDDSDNGNRKINYNYENRSQSSESDQSGSQSSDKSWSKGYRQYKIKSDSKRECYRKEKGKSENSSNTKYKLKKVKKRKYKITKSKSVKSNLVRKQNDKIKVKDKHKFKNKFKALVKLKNKGIEKHRKKEKEKIKEKLRKLKEKEKKQVKENKEKIRKLKQKHKEKLKKLKEKLKQKLKEKLEKKLERERRKQKKKEKYAKLKKNVGKSVINRELKGILETKGGGDSNKNQKRPKGVKPVDKTDGGSKIAQKIKLEDGNVDNKASFEALKEYPFDPEGTLKQRSTISFYKFESENNETFTDLISRKKMDKYKMQLYKGIFLVNNVTDYGSVSIVPVNESNKYTLSKYIVTDKGQSPKSDMKEGRDVKEICNTDKLKYASCLMYEDLGLYVEDKEVNLCLIIKNIGDNTYLFETKRNRNQATRLIEARSVKRMSCNPQVSDGMKNDNKLSEREGDVETSQYKNYFCILFQVQEGVLMPQMRSCGDLKRVKLYDESALRSNRGMIRALRQIISANLILNGQKEGNKERNTIGQLLYQFCTNSKDSTLSFEDCQCMTCQLSIQFLTANSQYYPSKHSAMAKARQNGKHSSYRVVNILVQSLLTKERPRIKIEEKLTPTTTLAKEGIYNEEQKSKKMGEEVTIQDLSDTIYIPDLTLDSVHRITRRMNKELHSLETTPDSKELKPRVRVKHESVKRDISNITTTPTISDEDEKGSERPSDEDDTIKKRRVSSRNHGSQKSTQGSHTKHNNQSQSQKINTKSHHKLPQKSQGAAKQSQTQPKLTENTHSTQQNLSKHQTQSQKTQKQSLESKQPIQTKYHSLRHTQSQSQSQQQNTQHKQHQTQIKTQPQEEEEGRVERTQSYTISHYPNTRSHLQSQQEEATATQVKIQEQQEKMDKNHFPQPKLIHLVDTNQGFQYVGYLVRYSHVDKEPVNKKGREWWYGIIKYWDPKYKSFFIHSIRDDLSTSTTDQQLYKKLLSEDIVPFAPKVLWVSSQTYYLLPLGDEPVFDRLKPMNFGSPTSSTVRDYGSTPYCRICRKKILYIRTDFTQMPKNCDMTECDDELTMSEFITEALSTYDYPNYLFRNPVHSTVLSLRELEHIGFAKILSLLDNNMDITKLFFEDYDRATVNLYNKSTLYFCVKLIYWLRKHNGLNKEVDANTRINLVYWGFKCSKCNDHFHAKCLQYQHLRKPSPVMDKQRINARLSSHKTMCKNFRIVTHMRSSYYSNENLYTSKDFRLDMDSEDDFDSLVSDGSGIHYKKYKTSRMRRGRQGRKRKSSLQESTSDEDEVSENEVKAKEEKNYNEDEDYVVKIDNVNERKNSFNGVKYSKNRNRYKEDEELNPLNGTKYRPLDTYNDYEHKVSRSLRTNHIGLDSDGLNKLNKEVMEHTETKLQLPNYVYYPILDYSTESNEWHCPDCRSCIYCCLPISERGYISRFNYGYGSSDTSMKSYKQFPPCFEEKVDHLQRNCLQTDKVKDVVCVSCNLAAHTTCCNPVVPNLLFIESWKCDSCTQCISCGYRDTTCIEYLNWGLFFFFCLKCWELVERSNYCGICYKVWTNFDSNSQKWVQCEGCKLWIHVECDDLARIITDCPSSRNQNYRCCVCRSPNKMTRCMKVLEQIFIVDKPNQFRYPVSPTFITYWRLVTKPMNLVTLFSKLEGCKYENISEFIFDIFLIPYNAKMVNMPNTKIYKFAIVFEKKCKQIVSTIMQISTSEIDAIMDSGLNGGDLIGDAKLLATVEEKEVEVANEDGSLKKGINTKSSIYRSEPREKAITNTNNNKSESIKWTTQLQNIRKQLIGFNLTFEFMLTKIFNFNKEFFNGILTSCFREYNAECSTKKQLTFNKLMQETILFNFKNICSFYDTFVPCGQNYAVASVVSVVAPKFMFPPTFSRTEDFRLLVKIKNLIMLNKNRSKNMYLEHLINPERFQNVNDSYEFYIDDMPQLNSMSKMLFSQGFIQFRDFCVVCGSNAFQSYIIHCEECAEPMHYYCAGFIFPPTVMDYTNFYCSGCTRCERCGCKVLANHPYELSNINNFHFGDALGYIPTLITNIVLFSSQVLVDLVQNQAREKSDPYQIELEKEKERYEGSKVKYATFLDGRFKVDQNGLIANMSQTTQFEQLSKFPICTVKCIGCGNSAHLSCIKVVKPPKNPHSLYSKFTGLNGGCSKQYTSGTSESTPTDSSAHFNASSGFDSNYMRLNGDVISMNYQPNTFMGNQHQQRSSYYPKIDCWQSFFPETNAMERTIGYLQNEDSSEGLVLKKFDHQKLVRPEEIPDSDEVTEHEFKQVVSMSKKLSICDDLISVIQSHINSGVVNKTNGYNYPTTTYKLLFKSHTYKPDDMDRMSNESDGSTYSNGDFGNYDHHRSVNSECEVKEKNKYMGYDVQEVVTDGNDYDEMENEEYIDEYGDDNELGSDRDMDEDVHYQVPKRRAKNVDSLSNGSDRLDEFSEYQTDEMIDQPRRDKFTTFFDLNSIFEKLHPIEEEDQDQQSIPKVEEDTFDSVPFLNWDFDGSGIFTCTEECKDRYNGLRQSSCLHDQLYSDALTKQFEVLHDTYNIIEIDIDTRLSIFQMDGYVEDHNENEFMCRYNYTPTHHTVSERDGPLLSSITISNGCLICGKELNTQLDLPAHHSADCLRDGDRVVLPPSTKNWTLCSSCKSYRKFMKMMFEKIGTEDDMLIEEFSDSVETESATESLLATLSSSPYSSILSASRKSVLMSENLLNYLITIISTLAPQISNTNLKKLIYLFLRTNENTDLFKSTSNAMVGSPFSPVVYANWMNSILNYLNDRKMQRSNQSSVHKFLESEHTFNLSDKMSRFHGDLSYSKYGSRIKYMDASHNTMIKRFTNMTAGTARFYWIYRDLLAYKIFFKNLGIRKRLRKSSPYYHYNKKSLQLLSNKLQRLLSHIINGDIYNDASSMRLKNRYPYFRRHLAHLIINGDIDCIKEAERNLDGDWFLRYTKVDKGTTSPSYILGRISYEGEAMLNILAEFIKFIESLARGYRTGVRMTSAVPLDRKVPQVMHRKHNEKTESQSVSNESKSSLSIFDSKMLNESTTETDFDSLYEAMKALKEKINTSVRKDNTEAYASNILGSSMLVDIVSARAITGDVAIRERIMEDNITSEFSSEQDNVINPALSSQMNFNQNDTHQVSSTAKTDKEIKNRIFDACCICGIRRNTVLRGSLLPWRNGYVHSECLLWSVSDVYLPRTFNFNYDNFYTLFEPVPQEAFTESNVQTSENYNEESEATTVLNETLENSENERGKYESDCVDVEMKGQTQNEPQNEVMHDQEVDHQFMDQEQKDKQVEMQSEPQDNDLSHEENKMYEQEPISDENQHNNYNELSIKEVNANNVEYNCDNMDDDNNNISTLAYDTRFDDEQTHFNKESDGNYVFEEVKLVQLDGDDNDNMNDQHTVSDNSNDVLLNNDEGVPVPYCNGNIVYINDQPTVFDDNEEQNDMPSDQEKNLIHYQDQEKNTFNYNNDENILDYHQENAYIDDKHQNIIPDDKEKVSNDDHHEQFTEYGQQKEVDDNYQDQNVFENQEPTEEYNKEQDILDVDQDQNSDDYQLNEEDDEHQKLLDCYDQEQTVYCYQEPTVTEHGEEDINMKLDQDKTADNEQLEERDDCSNEVENIVHYQQQEEEGDADLDNMVPESFVTQLNVDSEKNKINEYGRSKRTRTLTYKAIEYKAITSSYESDMYEKNIGRVTGTSVAGFVDDEMSYGFDGRRDGVMVNNKPEFAVDTVTEFKINEDMCSGDSQFNNNVLPGQCVDNEYGNEENVEPESVNLNLLNMPVLPPVQIPDTAVDKVYRTSLTTRCAWCNNLGATVTCANDNCKVSFHLCCAFISSSRLVHLLYKRDNPDHEYQERVLPVKMYYTRRKIWCASCFDLISQNMTSYHMKSLLNKNKTELIKFFSLEGISSCAMKTVCRQTLQSVRIIPRVVDYKKLDLYLSYNSKLYNKTKAMYTRAMVNHPHNEEVKEFLEGILKADERKDNENKISSEYDFKNKYYLYGADKDVTSLFSFKVPGLKFPETITHNVYRVGALTILNLGEALMHDKTGILYPLGFTSVRRFWNYNFFNKGRRPNFNRKSQMSEPYKSSGASEGLCHPPETRMTEESSKKQVERDKKVANHSQRGMEETYWAPDLQRSSEFNKKRDFGNSDRSFYLCSVRSFKGMPYFTIDLISHPCTNMPNRRLSQGNDLKEVYNSFKKLIGVKYLGLSAESFFGLNLHLVLQQMRFDLCSTLMRRATQFSKVAAFKNSVLGSRPSRYDVNLRLGEPRINYPFKISKQLMLEHITTSIEYKESEQSVVDMMDVRLNRSRSRKQLESGNMSTQYRYLISMPPEQRLDVKPSIIHGLGLFASVFIRAGEPVVEYVGELIRDVIGDQREEIYSEGQGGDGSCYMFRLDEQLIVDATRKGNMSRFINHSCDPNCLCRIITCENGLKHIVVFAKINIHPGDEITYDYQFGVESETRKLMCLCGAPNCLGRMN